MTEFLQDEVRSGFYVPTAIKQAWAVQLKILSEIDRICSKYKIRYFADWGTYLGAVRHGGFVPWDDDLDICMLREDYERFKQVAVGELPEGYNIHNFETKENHWLFLARVVNTDSISFDKKHLDANYNFPYIATVDIFILDYLYEDEEKEVGRCDEVKHIIALADLIVSGSYNKTGIVKTLGKLEKQYGLTTGSLYGYIYDDGLSGNVKGTEANRRTGIALYSLAEKQMGRTPKDEADRIGQIFPWILKGGRGLPKEYYEDTVRLPFEFTTIPVPACYHKGLYGRYFDYMKVCKIWGGHDYPYFEKQRENLQAVADFRLPEFTFDTDMLRENQPPVDKRGSLRCMAAECLTELEGMVFDICRGCTALGESRGESDNGALRDKIVDELISCQQLAVDLGTLIENVKGEKRESTIRAVGVLETFCEDVYSLYEYLQNPQLSVDGQQFKNSLSGEGRINGLRAGFKTVKENVERYVIDKKEVLFVSTGKRRWAGFKQLFERALNDGDMDVYVVDVPVFRKDAYGQILQDGVEGEQPDDYKGCLTDWRTYDLNLHIPDVIYIQDEYDGENPCLTLPKMYYAENLQRYTDKLILVPAFFVNEFKRGDSTDWYNMKHYVTAPGVVRADVVLVQSENMKRNYVEKLTEFAGSGTRDIWEKKISTVEDVQCDPTDDDCGRQGIICERQEIAIKKQRKKMMYCIGLNEIFEHREDIIKKVHDRLDIMKEKADKLYTAVCIYPPDKEVWLKAAPDEAGKIFDLIAKFDEKMKCVQTEEDIGASEEMLDSFDAYYGSPTYYAHYFNFTGKPVMLCDYSIDS